MNANDAYLEMQVNTMSSEKLLIALYDGIVRFCKISMQSIKQKDFEKASENLKYAQNIVLHLRSSLVKEYTPELTGNLNDLYSYWYSQLVRANQVKSIEVIQEVIELVIPIRDSFSQVEKDLLAEGRV